jgi:non-ribosomal peptide synthetase component F
MSFAKLARQLPARMAAGGFILNSGLSKWQADEQTATRLHGMATGTYPFLAKVPPGDFGRLLALAEIGLGGALLLPVVPAWLAGAALSAFSGGLLGMYLKTEGMHEPNSVRPTPQGVPLAKDIWMLGIGLGLLADDLTERDAKCGAKAGR